MKQDRKYVSTERELPATLKEAVQGSDQSSNNSVLGIDINHFKRTLDLFKYSLDYAEAIVNTVREPLVILNKDLQVMTANRAFYQSFNFLPEKLENRPFYELGEAELNIPKFRKLLQKMSIFERNFPFIFHSTRCRWVNAFTFRFWGVGLAVPPVPP